MKENTSGVNKLGYVNLKTFFKFKNSDSTKIVGDVFHLLKIKLPKKRTSFFFLVFFLINTNCLMNQVMADLQFKDMTLT